MRPLLALLILCINLPVLACGLPDARQLPLDDNSQLFVRLADNPRVGEHFAIDLLICKAGQAWSPERLKVDATMPAHRHGMNYRPRIKQRSVGRYTASGLLLHMPGQWRFHFDLAGDDWRVSTHFDYSL